MRYEYTLGNEREAIAFARTLAGRDWHPRRVGNSVFTHVPPDVTGPLWRRRMAARGCGGYACVALPPEPAPADAMADGGEPRAPAST